MRQRATISRQNTRKTRALHIVEPAPKPIKPHIGEPPNACNGGQTAGPMLSESQAVEALARCHPYVLSLVPKAIRAYADALDSDDLRLKTRVATKLFEGIGLFESRGDERFCETAAAVEQREGERRLIFGGMLMDMMLNKADMYNLTLPPDLEWLEPEFRKLEKLITERNKGLTTQGSAAPAEISPKGQQY